MDLSQCTLFYCIHCAAWITTKFKSTMSWLKFRTLCLPMCRLGDNLFNNNWMVDLVTYRERMALNINSVSIARYLYFINFLISKRLFFSQTRETSPWTVDNIMGSRGSSNRDTAVNASRVLSSLGDIHTLADYSWYNPDHLMLFTKWVLYKRELVKQAVLL